MLVQSVYNMLQLFRAVNSALQLQHVPQSIQRYNSNCVPQCETLFCAYNDTDGSASPPISKQSQRWFQIIVIPQDYKMKGKQTITTMYTASRLRLEPAILVRFFSIFGYF